MVFEGKKCYTMKIKFIFSIIILLIGNSLHSQNNKNTKEVDAEFLTFWKGFTTAYTNNDPNWFYANSNTMLFESCKGCGPFEIMDVEAFIDDRKDYKPDKESKKHFGKMAKIDLKKALNISECSSSYLQDDFGDGPTYKQLKLKGSDKVYEVVVDGVNYTFTKKNNKFQFLGIYYYE